MNQTEFAGAVFLFTVPGSRKCWMRSRLVDGASARGRQMKTITLFVSSNLWVARLSDHRWAEMRKVAAFLVIGTLFVWTWGVLNASVQGKYDAGLQNWRCESYRENLGISGLFAMMPPLWIASPFVTGFYENGWRLSKAPECK